MNTLTHSHKLRSIILTPYRKGYGPRFRLTIYETGKMQSRGYPFVGYRFMEIGNPEPIFQGDDFGCSPLHAIDSDETLYSLLGFLTLRVGDTDREYFADYTESQLQFCENHAEALSIAVMNKFPDLAERGM